MVVVSVRMNEVGAVGSMNELAKGWWEAAEVKAEVEAVVMRRGRGERVSECRGRRVLIRDRRAGSILAVFARANRYTSHTGTSCTWPRHDRDSKRKLDAGKPHFREG